MSSWWFKPADPAEEMCEGCGIEGLPYYVRIEDWRCKKTLCVACYSTDASCDPDHNSRELRVMVQLAHMLAELINPGVGFPIPPELEEGEPPKDEDEL